MRSRALHLLSCKLLLCDICHRLPERYYVRVDIVKCDVCKTKDYYKSEHVSKANYIWKFCKLHLYDLRNVYASGIQLAVMGQPKRFVDELFSRFQVSRIRL